MNTERVERRLLLEAYDFLVTEGKIPGVLQIEKKPVVDERGFFREAWRESVLQKLGLELGPLQWNHSRSKTGVLRGIHAEKWDKLVYPTTGIAQAVIVDLRPESKTFGTHESYMFDNSGENLPNKILFLPNGVGNSLCVIHGPVDYFYLVNEYWTRDSTFGINPFDLDLGIKWPVEDPILTTKDRSSQSLRAAFPYKF